MPLTTILAAKELSQSYQPLLLAAFTFLDGTVLRVASLDLRASTTLQYLGHDYIPALLNQNMAARQALSSDGIDGIPTVDLVLADADKFYFLNYEITKGWKGATCSITLVFIDLATNTFSSDSQIIFTGVCDGPNTTDIDLSVRAVSKMNMQRANLPLVRIGRRSPWPFPNHCCPN